MKNRIIHSEETIKRRQYSLKKVNELTNLLKTSSQNPVNNSINVIPPVELANSLFAKAPIEFLERKSLSQLSEIANECSERISKLKSNKKNYIIDITRNGSYTSLISVIGDRPFIVNSLTYCLEALGHKIHVFLHPIVLLDGYRTSLVYLETDALSPEQVGVLQRNLEGTLSDLMLATDDYTSMLVRAETLAKLLDNPTYQTKFPLSEKQEVAAFLRWLSDGGYIFLGYAERKVRDNDNIENKPSINLGIFKSQQSYSGYLLEESREDCVFANNSNDAFYFSKLRIESLVHRRVKLNNITIPEYSSDGRLLAWHSFIGILTSKALSQESSSIPLIRRKLQKVIELEEVVHNSHDYKFILDIIDHMPKDQALRLDIEGMREIIHTIIGIQNKSDTRVNVRFDNSKRGVTVLVVLPRERFNLYVRDELQQYIEATFGAQSGSSEYHIDVGEKPLARFYFYVPLNSYEAPSLDLKYFEDEINDISRTWEENLEEQISISGLFSNPTDTWFKYSQAFPEDYKALQSVEDCIIDIQTIETLSFSNPIQVVINEASSFGPQNVMLAFYNLGGQISISKAFPILENAGLEVISERSSCITPFGSDSIFVHRFLVKPKSGRGIEKDNSQDVLSPGLCAVLKEQAENDRLNSLMLDANLSIEAISLLRTYCALLWQVSSFATRGSILDAFSNVPKAATQFWNLFCVKFDPNQKLSLEQRKEKFTHATSLFGDTLREVKDINRDRTLRALLNLLEHTVRTNYFQRTGCIALKIQSELVEIMPNPRPKFEVFLSSPTVEGVHLRGGLVARGGIRWSDRVDDFRSEVLGLMKTQKIKNAVIVPNGAKGGFILRQPPKEQEQIGKAVQEAYKQYIRALLSVVDNIIENQVTRPDSLIIYDGDDPYFVVAADKGTATFSDTANKIAVEEFNFWLGDAFASGGSKGYDHKKYAITAKGAWQCVNRHFDDLAIDIDHYSFTVVGIGDMSGDVFGNGMLLSKQIKLIGAFNHKHIFLDPDPDPSVSFTERQRLFQLPRSQWTDYKSELISKGGGVFERFAKEIKLTSEIRESLSIPSDIPDIVSGEVLISCILKAKVDLLWNGGIGTYVKSSRETHAEVNDGTNDRVRINSTELRAKVVAEGGNLGFTQLARIEFAQRGGKINTDAIDNSAGVDLSDHEVNLKILFAKLIKDGKLNTQERDKLLVEIENDVVDSVLKHNRNHAALLSIGDRRSVKSKEYYKSLVRLLHSDGYINRHLEHLPDDEEFHDRILKKVGLTRPELAVFMAGVKMWIKDVIFESNLCNDPALKSYLLDYFPKAVREKFAKEISEHTLAKNIIASQVANSIIDSIGITFVHRMCVTHSSRPADVIKCLLAASFIINTKQLIDNSEKYDSFEHSANFLKLRQAMGKTLRDATSWLLSYHGHTHELGELVKIYQDSYQTMLKHTDELFVGESRVRYLEIVEQYNALKLDDFTVRSLAVAPTIVIILEMLWAAKKSNKNVKEVARVFFQIMDCFGLNPVLKAHDSLEILSKWDHQLLLSAFEEIRRSISVLTCELLKSTDFSNEEVINKLKSSLNYDELMSTIEEIKASPASAAGLSLIARQLRTYRLNSK
jgi:glutamate dehydrogenase